MVDHYAAVILRQSNPAWAHPPTPEEGSNVASPLTTRVAKQQPRFHLKKGPFSGQRPSLHCNLHTFSRCLSTTRIPAIRAQIQRSDLNRKFQWRLGFRSAPRSPDAEVTSPLASHVISSRSVSLF